MGREGADESCPTSCRPSGTGNENDDGLRRGSPWESVGGGEEGVSADGDEGRGVGCVPVDMSGVRHCGRLGVDKVNCCCIDVVDEVESYEVAD